MSTDPASEDELRRYVEMDTDDLYALIVPDSVREQGFSRGGLVAHGRTLFRDRLGQLRETVCPVYRKRTATISDEVEAAALVAAALVGTPIVIGLPIIPLAALTAKIGLARLCAEET